MSFYVFDQINENILNSDNLDTCLNFINYLFIKDVIHKSGSHSHQYRIIHNNSQSIYTFYKDPDNKTYFIIE